ncbi:MAG TPA: pyruvate dehydrogenase (acetyl-transferring), homodimeric type, partial [Candidatus Limnocylindria bacterium]|nr:pyruvate dehydrogenase (acetyl-transferring), homodimeric type [Candidatus Limnocylindria bacterium]
SEAGAISSWVAAATSYSVHGTAMLPFYVYYSMFGFQRIGDLIWAAGDARARGFLLGATAGRTTLTGEGLQHDDGHSHVLLSVVPNVVAYDPAFAYELAIVVREGIRRMYGEQSEDVFYYITLYNENLAMPAKPEGVEDGVLRGLYRFKAAEKGTRKVQLVGSGPILHQALIAQQILADRYDIAADVWSAPSFQQLRDDALAAERWNRLHPDAEARVPYVVQQLGSAPGPIVAATDYMKAVPDMVGRWLDRADRPYTVLGTDGYGRSDTREALRTFFEVNPEQIAYAALHGLCLTGEAGREELQRAIGELGIDPEKPNPTHA